MFVDNDKLTASGDLIGDWYWKRSSVETEGIEQDGEEFQPGWIAICQRLDTHYQDNAVRVQPCKVSG